MCAREAIKKWMQDAIDEAPDPAKVQQAVQQLVGVIVSETFGDISKQLLEKFSQLFEKGSISNATPRF